MGTKKGQVRVTARRAYRRTRGPRFNPTDSRAYKRAIRKIFARDPTNKIIPPIRGLRRRK